MLAFKQYQKWLKKLLLLILMTTTFVIHPVLAQTNYPTDSPNLGVGEVVVEGTNGKYTGYVVVQGNLPSVWETLTDYDNFEKYMPNVVESNILESRENYKVFEQVQVFQFLVFSIEAKVKIVVNENYPKKINFKLVEGDVKSLQGSWEVEPLGSDRYLITHQVSVEPGMKSSINRNLFFRTYEDTMKKTLAVISQESAKRSN